MMLCDNRNPFNHKFPPVGKASMKKMSFLRGNAGSEGVLIIIFIKSLHFFKYINILQIYNFILTPPL